MSKKVLIVEDEDTIREALKTAVLHQGYDPLVARDGVEGLDIALREHPDAILTDVKMPVMDGLTMMHKIRGDEWGNKVPIIVLTNYDNTDEQLDQISIDAPAYYLVKVYNTIEQIMNKIGDVLNTNKRE